MRSPKKPASLQGDILIAFDGRSERMSESQIMTYLLRRRQPGDMVSVTIFRSGEQKTLSFVQQ